MFVYRFLNSLLQLLANLLRKFVLYNFLDVFGDYKFPRTCQLLIIWNGAVCNWLSTKKDCIAPLALVTWSYFFFRWNTSVRRWLRLRYFSRGSWEFPGNLDTWLQGIDVTRKTQDLGCRGRESSLSFLSELCLWWVILLDKHHWLLSHGWYLQFQRFVFFCKNFLKFNFFNFNFPEWLDFIVFYLLLVFISWKVYTKFTDVKGSAGGYLIVFLLL